MAYCASRGLGVIRQTLFNALFGAGPEANAYYAAARLPDTIFELIAGGALTHAFIPVFLSHEKEQGQREAWRLASLVFNVLLVALTAAVLLAELIAPVFVSRLLVPGYSPSEQALTTTLTRILLLQPLILGLGTVATSILNSKRRFLLPAISLGLYDTGIIAGLICSFAIPGLGIYGPTCGIVASAVIQVLVMVPGLVKQKIHYSFFWDIRYPGLRQVIRLLIPNVLAITAASIAPIIDTAYISYMPDHASLSAIRNAQLLFNFPYALIAQAIGQAALPVMAAFVAVARYERLRRILVKLLSSAFFLSIGAALFLYLFGRPLIHLLFQHGAFGRHASAITSTALLGYALALPCVIIATLLTLSFYALKDARPPLISSILSLATRWLLIVLLLRLLTGSHTILAIPLATGGGGLVETLFLGSLLIMQMRSRIKLDRGMQRLAQWRRHMAGIEVL